MPGTIKDYIHGYRANPENKYGAKDYMETLPTEYDKYTLSEYVRAMREGKELGVPQLTPQQLANMALHEGRDDFGLNQANSENKNAMEIAKILKDKGINDNGALFAAAVYDKHQVANRLKIPFEHAWNGVGVTSEGRSGADYAEEAKQMNYAATHPKNTELVDYINRAMDDKLSPQEILVNKIRAQEENDPYLISEVYKKSLLNKVKDPNAQKLLQQADPDMLQTLMYNKVRESYNVNPRPIMPTNSKTGYVMPGATDAAQITSLAIEHPEIQNLINAKVEESKKQIGNTIPQYKAGGKVKLPDGYKNGGSSSLI